MVKLKKISNKVNFKKMFILIYIFFLPWLKSDRAS